MMAARKSVRMSVVPTTFKSSRFTLGGSSGRSGKINSPTVMKRSPRTKKLGTVTKTTTSRLTISAKPSTAIQPTTVDSKEPKLDEDKAKKRMSRIPGYPGRPTTTTESSSSGVAAVPVTQPRTVFACTTCKKTFHLKSTLTQHQKMHQTTSAIGTDGKSTTLNSTSGHFKCSYCDKDFEKEVGLRNHMERYCEKVPVAEKRKLNGSHNRTRTTSAEVNLRNDRSGKRENKSSSSKLESTSSSVGSTSTSTSATAASITTEQQQQPSLLQVMKEVAKRDPANQIQAPVALATSPRKPIKSISHPHSGMKFNANKPMKCYHCKITFSKYVDFHAHVDLMHPQVMSPPQGKKVGEEKEGEQEMIKEGELGEGK